MGTVIEPLWVSENTAVGRTQKLADIRPSSLIRRSAARLPSRCHRETTAPTPKHNPKMPHSITGKHRPKRDATDTRPNEKKRRKMNKKEAEAMSAEELKVLSERSAITHNHLGARDQLSPLPMRSSIRGANRLRACQPLPPPSFPPSLPLVSPLRPV